MKRLWIWAGLWLVTFVMAGMMVTTEARYLRFVDSLDEVDTQVRWTGTHATAERVQLLFEVEFFNGSSLPLWVEAINTAVQLDGEFAGAYTISEGRYLVPVGERRSVPLTVTFWAQRQKQLQAARNRGGTLFLAGRARVRFGIGQARLKTFYWISGAFPLKDSDGL